MAQPDPTSHTSWKGLALGRSLPGADWPVLLIAALLLAGGMVHARTSVPGARAVEALDGELRLTLPAGWVGAERAGVYRARPAGLELSGPSIEVRSLAPPAPQPTEVSAGEDFLLSAQPSRVPDAALATETELSRMEDERRQTNIGYHVLDSNSRRPSEIGRAHV